MLCIDQHEADSDKLHMCSFEVETDGDSIDILDVSLDKMRDEDSTEKEEEEDEDEEIYGGPVCCHPEVSELRDLLASAWHKLPQCQLPSRLNWW